MQRIGQPLDVENAADLVAERGDVELVECDHFVFFIGRSGLAESLALQGWVASGT
jgi:hypothetical protein